MQVFEQWPDGKKAVVLPTVNLDGEQFWLGMFPEAATRPKTLSMGDYGIKRGLDRVLVTLRTFAIKTTFFVPGMIAQRHPEAIEKILKDGHELALHGHTHVNMALLSPQQQLEELELGKAALAKVSGTAPVGFRAPEGELTMETLTLAKQCGFVYSSSLYDDDRPYILETPAGNLLELPMHWAIHDFPYFAFNYGPAFPSGQSRVASYKEVTETYQREFDGYYHFGLAYVAQFTPQSIGSPGKIKILEDILTHITANKDLWIGTCGELAKKSVL